MAVILSLNPPSHAHSRTSLLLFTAAWYRYLQPLVDSFRALVLQNVIKPYRDVKLDFLAKVG